MVLPFHHLYIFIQKENSDIFLNTNIRFGDGRIRAGIRKKAMAKNNER